MLNEGLGSGDVGCADTRAVLQGERKGKGPERPAETDVHRDALFLRVTGPSLLQRLAVGGWWRLAVGGGWRLVAVGGWWRLAVGGWWWLAVGGWWRLAVGGWWRLVAVGGCWLVVPGGLSLRVVLSKKKIGLLRTALADTPSPQTTGKGPAVVSAGALPMRMLCDNFRMPPCGDTWVCQVVIALWEITQATACTAKKRSRLITNRNVRS